MHLPIADTAADSPNAGTISTPGVFKAELCRENAQIDLKQSKSLIKHYVYQFMLQPLPPWLTQLINTAAGIAAFTSNLGASSFQSFACMHACIRASMHACNHINMHGCRCGCMQSLIV